MSLGRLFHNVSTVTLCVTLGVTAVDRIRGTFSNGCNADRNITVDSLMQFDSSIVHVVPKVLFHNKWLTQIHLET